MNTYGGSILIYIKYYYHAHALYYTISHNVELFKKNSLITYL